MIPKNDRAVLVGFVGAVVALFVFCWLLLQ